MRAPYKGGLEISDRWRIASWEPIRVMVLEASGAGAAEVLGETLSNNELEALINKVADCPSILDKITGSKALVGGIEEREVVSLLHDGSNLGPLVLCWVNASRVVCTGMEDEDGTLGSRLQSLLEALEIKSLGLLVKVGEQSTQVHGTGTRDCLQRRRALLLDGGGVRAED
ncbi:hypothetical protein HG530_010138 [Fusarium avenaceum]|nr:hypothetical protein HG530_010138 [Fusarium avenaceum]